MNLNEKQKEAINLVDKLLTSTDNNELLITGQSGTGKTTIVKAIIKYIEDKKLLAKLIGIENDTTPSVILTASTNKAAAVLSQLTERSAKTIHSVLALRPQIDYSTGECKFLPSDDTFMQHNAVLIIDEMSFIDETTYRIIREQTSNCKIIWVGDHYQLKPIQSRGMPVYRNCQNIIELTEIMRNKGGIQLLGKELRKAIDTHIMPALDNSPNVAILGKQEYMDNIRNAFLNNEDAKIVAWRNASVLAYNNFIQKDILHKADLFIGDIYTINDGVFTSSDTSQETIYLPTDSTIRLLKIIGETANMHIIRVSGINGVTGSIQIPKEFNGKAILLKQAAKEKDWQTYYSIKKSVVDLRLPYASTVNKAQGSTHDHIFLDLGDVLQCKNLDTLYRMLYVGCTRASKQLTIYDSTVG